MFTNRSISRVFSVFFVLVFTLTQVTPAYAAPGDLDPTFDGDGIVTTPVVIQNGNDIGQSVVIQASATQADSKIVMVGYSQFSNGTFFTVVRYNDDGSLDTSFDGDGIVNTSLSGSYPSDQAKAVVIQPDGKIVVAGIVYGSGISYQYRFGVARYNSDGSLDTSFDTDGMVTTNVAPGGAYQQATSAAIQPDGKIVVVGYSYASSSPVVVVRYNSDGSLDSTFDMDGIVSTSVSSYQNTAFSVAIQSDGKIVLAGIVSWGSPNWNYEFLVLRYNDDGSLDTSFDTDGIVTTSVGAYSQGRSVAIQPDGKIVVAGNGRNNEFAVVRYNIDGSLDTSFSTDGMMTTYVRGFRDFARSVTIQGDGQIVVVGAADSLSYPYDRFQFGVVRINGSDGSLDTSFDGDGIVVTNLNGYSDEANSVAIQSDGKIVVGGTTNNPQLNETDIAVVRYNNDGTLDSSFDNDGIVTTNISRRQYSTPGNDLAIQIDGKIVMVGTLQTDNLWKFRIVRFNTDGGLDASFGTDGIVMTTVGSYSTEARAVAIQTDGKIVVAGSAQNQIAVVRYNEDGSLDTSFSADGIMTTYAGGQYAQGYAIAIQNDGQIVVAGLIYGPPNNLYQFGVIRLNGSDGSLDTSFDADGIATTGVGGNYDIAYSVAIQDDGRIVLAGNAQGTTTNNQTHFGVVRYNTDGSLDTSFDTDGIVITNASGNYNQAKSIAIQSDGQIVVVGHGYGPSTNNNNRFIVVRYNNSDGGLDSSFDTDGIATPIVGGSSDQAYAVAIQSDGQIVVAGNASGPATNYQNRIGVVRLNKNNGSLDTSFNADGIVTTSVSGYSDQVTSVAIQTDGKLVVGGITYFSDSNASRFMVVRYEGGGSAPILTDQIITVNTSAPSSTINGSSFTVDATASSGLPVSYSSSGSCTNIGADFTMTSGTGTCTVMYDQAGNAGYNPAPQVTEDVIAQPADQAITVTINTPSSAIDGSSFTVEATASSGLPVSYSASGACTNAGAVFTMTSGTGTCTVRYDQAGDSTYNPAPQVTQIVTAAPAPTTGSLTIVKNANPPDDTDFPFSLDPAFVRFLLKWGTSGSGNGQFNNPLDVAVDSAGNVYVADRGNNRIQKFNSSGAFLLKWGTTGSGNGQFQSPVNVALDGAGNVYVADAGNHRIQKFDSSGNFLLKWGTFGSGNSQFSSPQGVALDSAGNVYVADTGNTRIQKFDSSGAFLLKWGTSGSGNGQFGNPLVVAVDGASNVYVADTGNHRIQKFNSSGAFLLKWGASGSGNGQFSGPANVALDSAGYVYVTDFNNRRIQKFDSSGAFLLKWGTSGSGDGEFTFPNGVAVDSAGNVYVADQGNNRIQKFEQSGFSLDDAIPDDGDTIGSSRTFTDLLPGTYTVTEGAVAGWSLDSIVCDSGSPSQNDTSITVAIVAGDNITCTFTNVPSTVDQTITVNTHAPASAINGSNFTVAASASSGLPVSYSSSGSCTNVGADFTMTSGTGTCTVMYDQAGNASYNPAPQVTEVVTALPSMIDQSITINTSAPTSAVYGSGFTVAATASSLLPVTYSSSGSCTNVGADFTMTSGTGTCTVIYDQAGDSSYNPAPQVTEVVNAERAILTVTADDQSKVYGSADPAFTFSYSGFVGGDGESNIDTPPTCSVTGAHVNVDSYPITCSGAVDNNYTFSYVDGSLTITAKPITVTADPQSKVYGMADPDLTYQVTTGALESSDNFTGALTRVSGEDVDSYAITQGTLSAGSNYDLTYIGNNLTITPKPITVTADPQSKVYGTADPDLTYQVTTGALESGDNFTGVLTRVSGEDVGTYSISQGILSAGSNYSLTFVGNDLTITKADQTIINVSAPISAVNGQVFTVSADATSNLPITYSASGACTNVGADFTMTSGEGACTVIFDQVGDANFNPAPQVTQVVADATPPTIISSLRADTSPTNAASVNFTVTFSESVTGVDASDFILTTTGVSGAAVSGVSGSGAVYTVTVNTGSGNGTIRLDVADNDSITDGASNNLGGAGVANGNYTVGQVYTIDKTAPTILSILRADPNNTAKASVRFTVTFSENVTGVDASDFILITSGVTGASITAVSGSGATYTVTVNTGTGNGTIRLRLIDDDTIADSAGNKLGGAGAGNGNFTGQPYSINKTLTYSSIAAQDGWILESGENTNTGGTGASNGNVAATTFNLGDNAQDRQYRSILHFNTISLPDNAVITSITLRIRRSSLVGSNPFSTHQGLLVDITKPYFGTSAGLQAIDFNTAANQSNIGTFGATSSSNWYTALLGSNAYSYVNLTGTTQLRLRFQLDDNDDLGADYMTFFSGNSTAANRPQLIITYYVP